jgi:hypothetical protein
MTTEEYRDEADAAEDLPTGSDPGAPEVPEADALEQQEEVTPTADELPESVGDAPEGDALEQALPAGDDGELDDRR